MCPFHTDYKFYNSKTTASGSVVQGMRIIFNNSFGKFLYFGFLRFYTFLFTYTFVGRKCQLTFGSNAGCFNSI